MPLYHMILRGLSGTLAASAVKLDKPPDVGQVIDLGRGRTAKVDEVDTRDAAEIVITATELPPTD